MTEYSSSTAQKLAESGKTAKEAADKRNQERIARGQERKQQLRDKFGRFTTAAREAWSSAGDKLKSGASEAGQMIADSAPVRFVDNLQATAREKVDTLAANAVDKVNGVTNGIAEAIDNLDRKWDGLKAGLKAKAAEVTVDGLQAMLRGAKALQEEVTALLATLEQGAGKAVEGSVQVASKLEGKAGEYREQQKQAQEKAAATSGLRGKLRQWFS